jgi:transketolase
MQPLPHLRADEADAIWPDRDRVLASPDAPPPDPNLASCLGGPPGLAFGAALGLALAERLLAARFGRSLVDHRTWLTAGPAELAAGTSHEAAAIAGALKLGRLTVLAMVDAPEGPALSRFAAMGWAVRRVTAGRDEDMAAAVSAALRAQKPTLIAMLRHPGRDFRPAPLAQSPYGPGARRAWLKRLRRHAAATAFQHALSGPPPRLASLETDAAQPPLQAAGDALARLAPAVAELTVISPEANSIWAGRHHATAAALLGMALHGGVLPAAWLPPEALPALVPAAHAAARLRLRMACLVPADVADDIGAALTFRPGSGGEAVDCLALALRWPGPSVLGFPAEGSALPAPPPGACARGGYILAQANGPTLTLVAAGADLAAAIATQAALEAAGIKAAIAAMPCRRLFEAQDPAYRDSLLGDAPRIILGSGGAGVGGRLWSGLLGPGAAYIDVSETTSPAALAGRIQRRLQRSADIQESADLRLETATEFD